MGKKRRKHSTGIGTPNTSRALAAASVAAISKRKAKKRRKNKHGAGSNATAKEPSQVEVEKKIQRKQNRALDNRRGAKKGTKFQLIRAQQRESSTARKENLKTLLRLKFLEKDLVKREKLLRNWIIKKAPEKPWRHPHDKTGRLYGAARPAISLEISDHGCGLRKFECEERCQLVKDETKDLWSELTAAGTLSSNGAGEEYCKTAMECAEVNYSLNRTQETIDLLEQLLVWDKVDVVGAKTALEDIEFALQEEKGEAQEDIGQDAMADNALDNEEGDEPPQLVPFEPEQ
jgi:hypothetical protein|eukprot:g1505.t1